MTYTIILICTVVKYYVFHQAFDSKRLRNTAMIDFMILIFNQIKIYDLCNNPSVFNNKSIVLSLSLLTHDSAIQLGCLATKLGSQ